MIEKILLIVLLQACFFAFYFKLGFMVSKIIGRRVCPVCFSVGSTWLTLIVLGLTGLWVTPVELIALLLAESVVGVSYLAEEFQIVYGLNFDEYLLKFGIIIYGTAAVSIFVLVNQTVGFLLFLPVIIFGFASLTPNSKH